MKALIEIIVDGVKKFGGEIIAAVLLAIAFGIFPSLRKLFRKKDESYEEVKQRLEQVQNVLSQTLQQTQKKYWILYKELCKRKMYRRFLVSKEDRQEKLKISNDLLDAMLVGVKTQNDLWGKETHCSDKQSSDLTHT